MSAPKDSQKVAISFLAGISLTGGNAAPKPTKSTNEIQRTEKKSRKKLLTTSATDIVAGPKLQKASRSTSRSKDRKISPRFKCVIPKEYEPNLNHLRVLKYQNRNVPARRCFTTGLGHIPYAICSVISIDDEDTATKRRATRTESIPVKKSKHVGVSHVAELLDMEEDSTIELLDDPSFTTGRHRTVMELPGARMTVLPYVKKKKLNEELNEKFRDKHPHIKVKLSSIRSLKKAMLNTGLEYDLDLSIIAMSYAYFERLIVQGYATPDNRKQIAGVCLLIAAKFYHFSTSKSFVIELIELIEKTLSTKDILQEEVPVFIWLKFKLNEDPKRIALHYSLLQQRVERTKYARRHRYAGFSLHNNVI